MFQNLELENKTTYCHPELTEGHPELAKSSTCVSGAVVSGSNKLNVAKGDSLSDWIPDQATAPHLSCWCVGPE